jgi:hypothetical protein
MLHVGQAAGLKRKQASEVAGFAAVTIATAALIGSWAGLPLLSSWSAGLAAMKPVTALCLAALGVALMYSGKNPRFAVAVGLVITAIATLDLGKDLWGIDFAIDRWLAPRDTVPVNGAASFRMVTGTKLAMAFAGVSLALGRFERHRLAASVLASIVGGITTFALLGYLSAVDTLYGSASVNSPSLPAAVGLLCIAVGIIFRIGTMPALRKSRPLWHLLVMLGRAIVAPLLLFGAYAGQVRQQCPKRHLGLQQCANRQRRPRPPRSAESGRSTAKRVTVRQRRPTRSGLAHSSLCQVPAPRHVRGRPKCLARSTSDRLRAIPEN